MLSFAVFGLAAKVKKRKSKRAGTEKGMNEIRMRTARTGLALRGNEVTKRTEAVVMERKLIAVIAGVPYSCTRAFVI